MVQTDPIDRLMRAALASDEEFVTALDDLLRRDLRIREFPVEWTCDRNSRLSLARNAGEILRDLIRLKPLAVKPVRPPPSTNARPTAI